MGIYIVFVMFLADDYDICRMDFKNFVPFVGALYTDLLSSNCFLRIADVEGFAPY